MSKNQFNKFLNLPKRARSAFLDQTHTYNIILKEVDSLCILV